MQRSGWSQEAVEKVLASQASRAQRLAAADACLFNQSLSLEELAAQVNEAWQFFGL
jgi:dephospho-CoA kinase